MKARHGEIIGADLREALRDRGEFVVGGLGRDHLTDRFGRPPGQQAGKVEPSRLVVEATCLVTGGHRLRTLPG